MQKILHDLDIPGVEGIWGYACFSHHSKSPVPEDSKKASGLPRHQQHKDAMDLPCPKQVYRSTGLQTCRGLLISD